MSTAKAMVIDRINNISDNLDEMQIIERLYMLARLEHSIKRCEEEGSISDSDLDSHFKDAKRKCVREDSGYMVDFVTDENGLVEALHYDKVKSR